MPDSFPTPPPPVAEGTGLPWDVPVDDAVAAIAAARARHGDTFVVNSGDDQFLRRKLPDDIFVGRRVLPNSLFRRDDVAAYLANLRWALNETLAELGAGSSVDLFDLTRRIGHRMGLASWGGTGIGRWRRLRTTGIDIRHPGRLGCVRPSRRYGGRRRIA